MSEGEKKLDGHFQGTGMKMLKTAHHKDISRKN